MVNSTGRTRSQRQQRVGELLRHAIAEVMVRGELRDPVLVGASVTVTEVTISPDLKNATAWVMPLGGKNMADVEEALNRCARFVRGQVGRAVTLKHTPVIQFQIDHSFDQADRVSDLLNRSTVQQDLNADDDGQPAGSAESRNG